MWSVVTRSPHFDGDHAADIFGHGAVDGRLADVGASVDFYRCSFRLRQGRNDHAIIDLEVVRHLHPRKVDIQGSGVGESAGEGGCGSDDGACQVNDGAGVPDLSLKFRLLVRTDTESVRGTCCCRCKSRKPIPEFGLRRISGCSGLRSPQWYSGPGANRGQFREIRLLEGFCLTILATVMRST